MKRILLFMVLVLVLIMVFAFFSFAEVKNPDTIIYLDGGAPQTMDTDWSYDSTSTRPIIHMYEGLVVLNPEAPGTTELVPAISTEVPSVENGLISEDGLTYTFPIREGVKFHNGDIVTPEDIAWSWKRFWVLDRSGGSTWLTFDAFFGTFGIESLAVKIAKVENYSDLFENGDPRGELKSEYKEVMEKVITDYIDKAVTVDGNKVIFHLAKPFPPFLQISSLQGGHIKDKKWAIEQGCWDGRADNWWKYHDPECKDNPLYAIENGAGPFTLKKWIPEEIVILERFDDYWRGPAKVKNVQIKAVKEWTTRKLMLQNGDADIIQTPVQYLDEVKRLEGVRVVEGLPKLSNVVLEMTWTINPEGNKYIGSGKLDGEGIPPDFFSDIHVRKGLCYLFPYDIFITKTLKGNAIRNPGPLVKPLLGYSDDPSLFYNFNLEKAKEELKQAWGGQLWEKGCKFSIVISAGNETRKSIADMLATYLRMINPKFKVSLVQLQRSSFLGNKRLEKYPMHIQGWGADYPDPNNFFPVYIGSKGNNSSILGRAYREFAEKNVDPLCKKAIEESDPEKRAEIYKELTQIAHDQAISIYVYQKVGYSVERTWIRNYIHGLRGIKYFYFMYKEE